MHACMHLRPYVRRTKKLDWKESELVVAAPTTTTILERSDLESCNNAYIIATTTDTECAMLGRFHRKWNKGANQLGNASSRTITEVERHLAWTVLGWETTSYSSTNKKK